MIRGGRWVDERLFWLKDANEVDANFAKYGWQGDFDCGDYELFGGYRKNFRGDVDMPSVAVTVRLKNPGSYNPIDEPETKCEIKVSLEVFRQAIIPEYDDLLEWLYDCFDEVCEATADARLKAKETTINGKANQSPKPKADPLDRDEIAALDALGKSDD